MLPRRCPPRWLAALLLASTGLLAQAQQTVIGVDGQSIALSLPAKGLTLIKTEGAKLLRVRYAQSELAMDVDAEKGEVTIRPLKTSGPLAFFLVTDTATIPVNASIDKNGHSAKSLIVQVPVLERALDTRKLTQPEAADYIRAIKNMVVAAGPDVSFGLDDANYRVTHRGRSLPALGVLQVHHQRSVVSAAGLVAHRYIISNPTAQRALVDERALYSPNTLAVALEHAELDPGAATVAVVVQTAGAKNGRN